MHTELLSRSLSSIIKLFESCLYLLLLLLLYLCCYGLNCVPFPPFICWSPKPQYDCIWDGALKETIWVKWSHKGGPKPYRTGILMRRGKETRVLSPSVLRRKAPWGHHAVAVHKPRRAASPETNLAGTLTLDCQAPKLWGNKLLLFEPLRLWHSVTAVPADLHTYSLPLSLYRGQIYTTETLLL